MTLFDSQINLVLTTPLLGVHFTTCVDQVEEKRLSKREE